MPFLNKHYKRFNKTVYFTQQTTRFTYLSSVAAQPGLLYLGKKYNHTRALIPYTHHLRILGFTSLLLGFTLDIARLLQLIKDESSSVKKKMLRTTHFILNYGSNITRFCLIFAKTASLWASGLLIFNRALSLLRNTLLLVVNLRSLTAALEKNEKHEAKLCLYKIKNNCMNVLMSSSFLTIGIITLLISVPAYLVGSIILVLAILNTLVNVHYAKKTEHLQKTNINLQSPSRRDNSLSELEKETHTEADTDIDLFIDMGAALN